MFKIELRKSIGLDEDFVEGMCLVSLVVIKAQKMASLYLYLCRKDALIPCYFIIFGKFLLLDKVSYYRKRLITI
ncbi:hypothetical protein F6R38_09855 [Staphylococcus aureus]|nr:hypothetical protein [Staphylococcus aureus]MBG1012739.1 hypothetical protein [Staphylococcus aureus]MBG1019679.1 hypothetical protein [Staphylococcus aureus]MBG1022170.1 hypothetical protein [Staphylococcus aureus]